MQIKEGKFIMTDSYVQVIPTSKLDKILIGDIHQNNLFFPYEALCYKDVPYAKALQASFTIEMHSIIDQIPDCKIGDFSHNVYYRPKRALSNTFEGYKTIGEFSRAVQACLRSHGWEFGGWVLR